MWRQCCWVAGLVAALALANARELDDLLDEERRAQLGVGEKGHAVGCIRLDRPDDRCVLCGKEGARWVRVGVGVGAGVRARVGAGVRARVGVGVRAGARVRARLRPRVRVRVRDRVRVEQLTPSS